MRRPGAAGGAAKAVLLKRLLAAAVFFAVAFYLGACCALQWTGFNGRGETAPEATLAAGDAARALRGGGDAEQKLSEEAEKAAIRAELGHGTWNMLHRLAAAFDKAPSAQRQADVVQFFRLFSELYPCDKCAAHFRAMLAESPVQAGSNRQLSTWLCERHNEVNTRLHKPAFDCSLSNLKEHYGSCGCFDEINATATTDAALTLGGGAAADGSSSGAGGDSVA